MDDAEFDRLLITAAFEEIAHRGWTRLSVAEAARAADLKLDRARLRFPGRFAVLWRLGRMADAAALAEPVAEGPLRDKLFGLLMRRIDVLQPHRAGVSALMRAIPADPLLGLVLARTNLRSMSWMLEAAGVSARGAIGRLRAKGLLAVWLATLRAWERDDDADLGKTMAALDDALRRAERVASWLPRELRGGSAEPAEAPMAEDLPFTASEPPIAPSGPVPPDASPAGPTIM